MLKDITKTIPGDVYVIHLTEKRYLVTYDISEVMNLNIEEEYKKELNRLNNRVQKLSGVELSKITGWSIRKAQRVKENFAIGYVANWEYKNICYKGKWYKHFKEISFREYIELKTSLFNETYLGSLKK